MLSKATLAESSGWSPVLIYRALDGILIKVGSRDSIAIELDADLPRARLSFPRFVLRGISFGRCTEKWLGGGRCEMERCVNTGGWLAV